MKSLYGYLLLLLACSMEVSASQQMDCSPLDPRQTVSASTSAKVEGSVETLYKIVKADGQIETNLRKEAKNLGDNVVPSESTIAVQRLLYILCEQMRTSTEISEARKVEITEELYKLQVSKLPDSQPVPEQPQVYYEDFSTTPEGGLPEGWTEGELFAVQHRVSESNLALSRTGGSVVKSKTIQFPKNFIMEVRLNIVGRTNAAVVLSHSLIGESLKIQVWCHNNGVEWYLKIDESDDKQFHFGNKTTLKLIKINDIFRLIANGDIHFSGRLLKYKEFDHVRFEFSDMNVGVLSIAVSPYSPAN